MKKELHVVVVGADWYGGWVTSFHRALRKIGCDAEIVHNNSLPTSLGGGTDAVAHVLERGKRTLRRISPRAFAALKAFRQHMAERRVLRQLRDFDPVREEVLVIFVWTPPSEWLLRDFRRRKGVTLALWLGEPTVRDATWEPLFDYFHHLFIVDDAWLWPLLPRNKKRMHILPLSSDGSAFHPLEEAVDPKYQADISFIGQYWHERADILDVVADYDLKVYGYGWEKGFPAFPWLREKYAGPVSTAEANFACNGSKIILGSLVFDPFTPETPFTTATNRTFDIALAGRFQMCGYVQLIEKIFGDSIKTFRTKEELRQLAAHYLPREKERQSLGERSRAIALKHTYVERAKELLRVCGFGAHIRES